MSITALIEVRWPGSGTKTVANSTMLWSGRSDNKRTEGVALALDPSASRALIYWRPISERLLTATFKHHHGRLQVAGTTKAPDTPGLRPGYDLPATEKWANRRKNLRLVAEVVRLVAEVVGDRKGQISRNKVVVMFKTRSHRAYDQVTTYLRSKNVGMMGQS